jgi:16S rRNA (adenine1518-N6/adenine1519-N6)-dimethyltransferase
MTKKLGQNFLIDKKVAQREVFYADINNNDVVLEIGPGKGILTKLLAKKAKKVISIEIDEKLIKNLVKSLPNNVELIHGDALKIDFNNLPKFNKIVSNLPFQISSPITFKFFEYDFSLAILIYQKEFAERIIAVPGNKNYSRLSVTVYYKAKSELLENISKNCFNPKPKVDSCMIKLIPRKKPPFELIDEKKFFDLVKIMFNNRRKKIKNVIKKVDNIELKDLPYLENRIEQLSPEQIGELCNLIVKNNYN